MKALAGAGLGVCGRQALAAVVGRKDGADTGGAAAQKRAALDELHVMAHLGELGGGLRAGHAAADHEHRVDLLVAHQLVGRRLGVGQGGVDDPAGLVGDGGDVVTVHPGAALTDVGDAHGKAPLEEAVEAPVGEVLRAAGEDEPALVTGLAPGSSFHELEQPGLALAVAPRHAAQHVGLHAGEHGELVEVDVRQGAGAFTKQHERPGGRRVARDRTRDRTRDRGAHGAAFSAAMAAGAPVVVAAVAMSSWIFSAVSGLASAACVGQIRAQVPQPRQRSSS